MLDLETQKLLMFALVAERLSLFYEHGQWLTEAQGATVAADWLMRSKRSLDQRARRSISALSDDMARHIAASLSREAGLYTAHEMMEGLDPNYRPDTVFMLLDECERRLRAGTDEAPPGDNSDENQGRRES